MQKLTKREEEIMQILWKLDKAFISEIIEEFPEPKPHYNTVATIIKILKNERGFVDYKKIGNMHQFYPLIEKEEYQQKAIGDVVKGYFDNSFRKMVAYFAKEEKISPAELEDIVKMIKEKDG
ncbi:MAG: BlaI/MecI/CopY family transcriptional regulator [Saprospiraceae bacterium]